MLKTLELLKEKKLSYHDIVLETSYIPTFYVNYEFSISFCDYDLEKLIEAHTSNKFIFNLNCLKLIRNHLIVYCNKDDYDMIVGVLKTCLREPDRATYFQDHKNSKNRKVNRSERGYVKQIMNRFAPNLLIPQKKELISYYDSTLEGYELRACTKKINKVA